MPNTSMAPIIAIELMSGVVKIMSKNCINEKLINSPFSKNEKLVIPANLAMRAKIKPSPVNIKMISNRAVSTLNSIRNTDPMKLTAIPQEDVFISLPCRVY
ncbi:MAG: hypothetical protein GY744_06960 [Gammaproteobacteria bacterium]|nr:hypothetical protein [Gammaproteobacteria bacterium]